MRLLAVGDVCGKSGCDYLLKTLPSIKKEKGIENMKKIYIFCSVIIAIIIVLCALSIMLQDYKMSKDIIVIKAEENLIIGIDKGNKDIIIVNSKKQNLSEFEIKKNLLIAVCIIKMHKLLLL